MERKVSEYYKFIFKNPWCPLYGLIPLEDNRLDSAITQCCLIIHNARRLLNDEGYYLPYGSIPSHWPPCVDNLQSPCDVCEKSKLAGTHHLPCGDPECTKHAESTSASEKAYLMAQYPPVEYVSGIRPDHILNFPCHGCKKSIGEYHISCNRLNKCKKVNEYKHALTEWRESSLGRLEENVLLARAIVNNFWAIKDHTLWWPDDPVFTLRYGIPDSHTLATVWERAIEQTKRWAVYEDGREVRSLAMQDFPDYIILSILAISLSWYTLKDILYNGTSENDPYVLKDTSVAKDLLSKADKLKTNDVLQHVDNDLVQLAAESEQKDKELFSKDLAIESLKRDKASLKGNAMALKEARKEKELQEREKYGPRRRAAYELAQSMANTIWSLERKKGSPISGIKATAERLKEKIEKKIQDGERLTKVETYLRDLTINTIRMRIKKSEIYAKKSSKKPTRDK